ncbi:hypothetical protein BT69DRAFT_1304002 [Atractiella rhizophila]|nr:hypothetical protein BT69DRAFT_1304002 [Atractiella rhizophila]
MAGDAIPQAFVKKTKKVGEFHDYIALQGQELVVKDDDHQDCPLRRKTTKNEEPPSLPMPSYEELMGCDDAHLKDFIVKLSWMELAEWEEEGSAAVFPDSLNQLSNTHFINQVQTRSMNPLDDETCTSVGELNWRNCSVKEKLGEKWLDEIIEQCHQDFWVLGIHLSEEQMEGKVD